MLFVPKLFSIEMCIFIDGARDLVRSSGDAMALGAPKCWVSLSEWPEMTVGLQFFRFKWTALSIFGGAIGFGGVSYDAETIYRRDKLSGYPMP